MPRSFAVILPSAETAVASCITSDAPPTARLPRCTRCQSFANPSSEEYSHMGETTMRFFSLISFIVKGENKRLIFFYYLKIKSLIGCYSRQSKTKRGITCDAQLFSAFFDQLKCISCSGTQFFIFIFFQN